MKNFFCYLFIYNTMIVIIVAIIIIIHDRACRIPEAITKHAMLISWENAFIHTHTHIRRHTFTEHEIIKKKNKKKRERERTQVYTDSVDDGCVKTNRKRALFGIYVPVLPVLFSDFQKGLEASIISHHKKPFRFCFSILFFLFFESVCITTMPTRKTMLTLVYLPQADATAQMAGKN